MFIKSISISNFKSFRDTTIIDFSDMTGLWRISGQIGAGKTTIGEAIVFGLYGSISGKNNKDLISWGQKHGLIEIWCESRGKSLYIHRELNYYGQSPLTVTVDGEPIVFTNKRDAQQQLESEYLDIPKTTMELLCIISFNSFKSLSTLNTKDTKIFLDQVLGLDVISKYVELCKEEQVNLSNHILALESGKQTLQAQLDHMVSQTQENIDINTIKADLATLRSEISQAQTELAGQLEPLKTELADSRVKLGEVKALGINKKREIEFIQKGTCPTCGAPIDQSSLSTKQAERDVLAEQYKSISAKIDSLTLQISTISKEMQNYIDSKLSLVKSKENDIVRYNEQSKYTQLNKTEQTRIKRKIKKLEKDTTAARTTVSEYVQLNQILSTDVRTKIIGAFIPSINNNIKEIAVMLGMRYIPEFDSQFKCFIKSDLQDIPTGSLSTGQLKLVDMVIILAVLKAVVNKTHFNIIFLDELFSNLDPHTRTDLVNVLRSVLAENMSVFIVSHQEMDTELFDGHIKLKLLDKGNSEFGTQIIINKN